MRFALFLALGCATACKVDPPPPEDGIQLCNENGDCAAGFICSNAQNLGDAQGICIAERSCEAGQSCGPGLICEMETKLCKLRPETDLGCAVRQGCNAEQRCVLIAPEALCPPEEACVDATPIVGCVKHCDGVPCGTPGEVCQVVQNPEGNPSPPVCTPCPPGCSPCDPAGINPLFYEATKCPGI